MNKRNIFQLLFVFSFSIILLSCKKAEVIVLPDGNLNKEYKDIKINTPNDEVSPQIENKTTRFEFNCEATLREPALMNPATNNQEVIVHPAQKFTQETLFPLRPTLNKQAYDFLTENVESVFFVNSESGFASIAYPPSLNYNDQNKLPFVVQGVVEGSGVDIYEFNYDRVNNRYIFTRLENGINTPFWDSNPTVITDTSNGSCMQVLIWASDRSSPFRYIEKLDNRVIYNLNKDLYYSFRINYGPWSTPKPLDDGDINTKSNEVTPYVYCSCCNPVLFFASNRDYGEKQTYDLYYAKLDIDYQNQTIKVKQPAKLVDPLKTPTPGKMYAGINSPWDERFPYIPPTYNKNSFDNYIYFISNRFNTSKDKAHRLGKDTIVLNVGGYDLYRFRLPENPDFDCKVPDPPEYDIYLKVTVNLKIYDEKGNVVDEQKNIPNIDYSIAGVEISNKDDIVNFFQIIDNNNNENTLSRANLKQNPKLYSQSTKGVQVVANGISQYTNHFYSDVYKTQVVYKLKKSHKYYLTTFPSLGNCESGDCGESVIVTPNRLTRNDTINVVIDCFKYTKPPVLAPSESYKNGIAFFVTGYWWPTTTKNLKVLKERLENNCLNKSQFIDISDYKPDHRDYYEAAAEVNDKFFYNELFPKIESMLAKIDQCHLNQKVLITIHSFTDPCPLRTIRDESGKITQEFTLYSCDPEIQYNDIIITPGIKMKDPDLRRVDGTPYRSNLGVQQGNVVLAMLRSYYTKETIINEFKEYARQKRLNYPIDKLIEFKLDAFGIFDEATKECSNKNQFWGNELANKKYPVEDEPCNIPFSRRTMIYVDLINSGDEKYLDRNECGQLIRPKPVVVAKESKKEKKPVEPKIEPPKSEKIDRWTEIEIKEKETQTYPCAGTPCYWSIQYGIAENEDQYKAMLKVLNSVGITDVMRNNSIKDKWVLVSSKSRNRNNLEKQLEDYKNLIKNKLKGLFQELEVNAMIIEVQ